MSVHVTSAGRALAASLILAMTVSVPGSAAEPSASPRASMAAGNGLDLCWDEAAGRHQPACALAAGDYAPGKLQAPMGFHLGDGWRDARYYADGFDIVRDDGPFDLSVVIAPATGVVFTAPAGGSPSPSQVAIGPTAADIVAYLAGHPALKVTAGPTAVTIGGLPATELDLRAVSDGPAILLIAEDEYNVAAGDSLRVWALDDGSTPVVVISEVLAAKGASEAAQSDIDALSAIVDAIVASLTFAGSAPASPGASVRP